MKQLVVEYDYSDAYNAGDRFAYQTNRLGLGALRITEDKIPVFREMLKVNGTYTCQSVFDGLPAYWQKVYNSSGWEYATKT